ncbi:hypothetical protein, partial [Nocardiopsis rhodophaea]|uniref:hypothetical protein n=1 Tax=Nocardiopsis rhodophaea TaxID=280238 RepID=UPI0039EE35D8
LQWVARPPPIVWFVHTHMITAVAVLCPGLDQTEISKCGWSIRKVQVAILSVVTSAVLRTGDVRVL